MPEPVANTKLTVITVSEDEWKTGRLTSYSMEKALTGIHENGIIALVNATDTQEVDILANKMAQDTERLVSESNTHFNFGSENIQQEPPIEKDYIFESILANKFVGQITSCVLGPQPQIRLYSSNVQLKGSKRQPVHIDVQWKPPSYPFMLLVNTYLTDVSPANGSTEVWPGTHLVPGLKDYSDRDKLEIQAGKVDLDILEARRKVCPPIQPTLPKGSIIIRDIKTWHAGMPSIVDQPRTMLVTAHFPKWYRNNMKVILRENAKSKLQSFTGEAQVDVYYCDDKFNYLKGSHNIDFAQDNVWSPE